MPAVLDKILRAGEGKILRKLEAVAKQVNALEDAYTELTDAELRALTDEYRERHEAGESLDDLLPEAFATVREAARRTLGQRHYDVQIMGGAALHLGNIAEMKTGEGKTLVSTLPAYLNALSGKGVHVVTVNDYLAERDSEWMGRVHRFLGLSVGVILSGMTPVERREAYGCDITYGTNNELGFDYLRDNMAWSKDELCSAASTSRSSTRSTPSSSTRRAPRSSSAGPPTSRRSGTSSSRSWSSGCALDEHYEKDEKKRTVGIPSRASPASRTSSGSTTCTSR